ncbi:MAG: HAD-IIIA family hydrolase [Defluviitaleaceae bacterium]|nr:HAD-IIIA family hydrolase [Defluviitaleaceae bacterium]
MTIKLIVLDVDGTLTDGSICYGSNEIEMKSFNVKDGAVLKPLSKLGISVIFLTGRESEITARRAKELNIKAIQGVSNKKGVLTEYISEHGIKQEEILYIGDDINDYAAMKLCSFKACPADAVNEIRNICDYTSPLAGGQGAVRDIIEMMLRKHNKWNDFLDLYGA